MANHKEKKEKYIEFESIKSGGQGIIKKVFKPENSKLIYARKQQSYSSIDEQKFLQLLIQQQQKQQQIKLLKIYEQYQENKFYYQVQEYCKKGDIRDKICEMKIDDVKKLILDLGEQLEFIHNNKYVFVDLKPENILISDDGIFKLCDFGSIKKIKLDQSDSIVDSRGGSDSYMPHDKAITMDFDIYSFGVIIYELYSHFKLFDDKQQVQSYFDGEFDEIMIKFQNHLVIDEIEKIFILLMIDTNELNRPDIQQVNLFYKSNDLGKKSILLSQLQKQDKYIKLLKIQFKIYFNSIFSLGNQQQQQNFKSPSQLNNDSSKCTQLWSKFQIFYSIIETHFQNIQQENNNKNFKTISIQIKQLYSELKNIYNKDNVSTQEQQLLQQIHQQQQKNQQQYLINQKEIQQQQEEIDNQKVELDNLENDKKINSQLLEQLKQQCEELRNQITLDQESLIEQNNQYQELLLKQSNQKEIIDQMNQKNAEVQQMIQQLQSNQQSLEEMQIQYERDLQQNLNLQLQIEQLKQLCEDVREQNQIDEKAKQSSQNRYYKLQQYNTQLNSEIETIRVNIKQLQNESQKVYNQIETDKEEQVKLTNELNEKVKSFENEKEELTNLMNKIQSYDVTIQEMKDQQVMNQDRIAKQKQELQQLNQAKNDLNTTLNTKSAEIIYQQIQIKDLEKTISNIIEAIEKNRQETQDLQETVNQLNQKTKDTKNLSPIKPADKNYNSPQQQQYQGKRQIQQNQSNVTLNNGRRITQTFNRNDSQFVSKSQPSLIDNSPIEIKTQQYYNKNYRIKPLRQPIQQRKKK